MPKYTVCIPLIVNVYYEVEAEISDIRHCTAEHVKAVVKYIRNKEENVNE